MVLEMVQVLELQRLPSALRVVVQQLLYTTQLLRVFPIEMVVYHRRSIVLERPFLVGQLFISDTARALLPVH